MNKYNVYAFVVQNSVSEILVWDLAQHYSLCIIGCICTTFYDALFLVIYERTFSGIIVHTEVLLYIVTYDLYSFYPNSILECT